LLLLLLQPTADAVQAFVLAAKLRFQNVGPWLVVVAIAAFML
jgi:hypothetical protein